MSDLLFQTRPQKSLQLQTTRDSYCLVAGFKTWRCEHCEPPTGGTCIGGAMDGGVISQTDKGQAGGISVLVVHRGTRRPSTHWQMHLASAVRVKKELATTTKVNRFPAIDISSVFFAPMRVRAHACGSAHARHQREPGAWVQYISITNIRISIEA
jgi:hypothetical protein